MQLIRDDNTPLERFFIWLFGLTPAPKTLDPYVVGLLETWYEKYVAKYTGAQVSAREIYEYGPGASFVSYLERYADRPVTCTEKQFIAFMQDKGHITNTVNGKVIIYGCRQVVSGTVTSGNYMT